jgi:D-3-phosphoglycerate dehydrogenase
LPNRIIVNFDPQFIAASRVLRNVIYISNKKSLRDRHYNLAEGLVVRLGIILDKNFLAKFKNLKFIATITTGTDHIDEKYCRRRKVKIISLKGETAFLNTIRATPEHAWALLLLLLRKIPWVFDSVRKGEWERERFFGGELYGRCFGIIGFGRVGRILSTYARAFGMRVVFYDNRKIKAGSIKQVSLDALLKSADIISVNLPLNNSTRHFLKIRHFRLMKKGAIVINTSRGAVIDENALLIALKRKIIGGAALDVLENEYKPKGITKKHPLIKYANSHDNLVITPHIAGSTHESMQKTAVFIAAKIKRFLQNNPRYP